MAVHKLLENFSGGRREIEQPAKLSLPVSVNQVLGARRHETLVRHEIRPMCLHKVANAMFWLPALQGSAATDITSLYSSGNGRVGTA